MTDTLARHDTEQTRSTETGFTATAIALLVAAACFVVYPAVRVFSPDDGLEAAAAWSSTQWAVAHIAAMIGFAGVLAATIALTWGRGQLASWAAGLMLIGVCTALPYYGGETFGLRAIGQYAFDTSDSALPGIAGNEVRWGPGIGVFSIAIIALAAASILLAVFLRGRGLLFTGAAILAAGFVLFLPQFVADQPLRVAHGVILAAGCATLAVGMLREHTSPNATGS